MKVKMYSKPRYKQTTRSTIQLQGGGSSLDWTIFETNILRQHLREVNNCLKDIS